MRDSAAIFAATARSEALRKPILGPDSKRLRIGYAPAPITDTPLHAEVAYELDLTAQLCRELGHEVIDYKPALDGDKFSDTFLLYWSAGAAQFAQDAASFAGKPPSPEILEIWTLGLCLLYTSPSPRDRG